MKTWAVVVAYRPSPQALASMAATLEADAIRTVIVDNTPAYERVPLEGLPPGCEVLSLGRNAGIAHAQNEGIAHARSRGAQCVVFLDQDSRIQAGFVSALAGALVPGRPGVVGPACFDAERGFEYPPYRFGRRGLARPVSMRDVAGPQAVDLIISSGSVATVETFDVAGAMDEAFFIDYVDLEWCARCRAHGVPIHVLPHVQMKHSIGQRSFDVGPLRTFVHPPARAYYRVRNAFLLLRRRHVPKAYAVREIAAALVHHLLLLPRVSRRGEHLRVGLLGLSHGLRGVTGARPE